MVKAIGRDAIVYRALTEERGPGWWSSPTAARG
jgi:hypothetical protein